MKRVEVRLQDNGMSRDTSVSKAEEGFAFENRNVRILADKRDTQMSVTSERGNRPVEGLSFKGTLVGWAVLDSRLVLFTTESAEGAYAADGYAAADGTPDRIYRVDYDPSADEGSQFSSRTIYEGRMGFDVGHPLETVTDYETQDIQKVYWVDGIHVLRFLNFADAYLDENSGRFTDDWFDTNRAASGTVSAEITRTLDGDPRANGVVQYFVTYYNKNGQETAWVYASPLVYLSPSGRGGEADGQCNAKVTLRLTGLDTSFDYVRLYSVETHSLDGDRVAYLVAEAAVESGEATLVDSGKPLEAVDASSLLFLGSRECRCGTLAHKDGTLFLGDITVDENADSGELRDAIEASAFEANGWEAAWVEYRLTDSADENIPLPDLDGVYPYESQLAYPNSRVTTFHGGEKYRFAVRFRKPDGSTTQAFWIGDKVNALRPVATVSDGVRRPLARCVLPSSIVSLAAGLGYATAQLMVARATYTDRSVLAQGVLSPTLFNVWERYNGRLYSQSSWTFRPRNSSFAWRHFEPVHISTDVSGEVECNWWDEENYADGEAPTPYYTVNGHGNIEDPLEGVSDETALNVLYKIMHYKLGGVGGSVVVVRLYADETASGEAPTLADAGEVYHSGEKFQYDNYGNKTGGSKMDSSKSAGMWTGDMDGFPGYSLRIDKYSMYDNGGFRRSKLLRYFRSYLEGLGISDDYIIDDDGTISSMIDKVDKGDVGWFRQDDTEVLYENDDVVFTTNPTWLNTSGLNSPDSGKNSYKGSYYKKHLTFVDENVVTLCSPEIETEAVVIEDSGLKLRVIGAAKVVGNITDYRADVTDAKYPGGSMYEADLSRKCVSDAPDGMQSWPLLLENAPSIKDADLEGDMKTDASNWYVGSSSPVLWWLRLFQRDGSVPGLYDVSDTDDSDAKLCSVLGAKTVANLRYCDATRYAAEPVDYDYDAGSVANRVRGYNYTTAQVLSLDTGGGAETYNANVDSMLTVPGSLKYPVVYSPLGSADDPVASHGYGLADPVRITYRSRAHAVACLGRTESGAYELLPSLGGDVKDSFPSGARLPWVEGADGEGSTFSTNRRSMPSVDGVSKGDRYVLIGELYKDYGDSDPDTYDPSQDTRYGGVSESAVEACTFIPAGPFADLSAGVLDGDEGDTFFQRWDGVKTVPSGDDDTNRVVDVCSAMVETHVNMDGRYDTARGNTRLAYLDWDSFGLVNDVYTQPDSFIGSAQLDERQDLDSYRSSVTWTLEKSDGADVDEWTHVTLASTLKLDGDKGPCRALRRWRNSLLAFQDSGICEVLFNSRTQMATTDGVPVELANTGKVDGKRYLTNSHGCTNKWSLAEGKDALYFVDDLNGAVESLSGEGGVSDLSGKARLSAWARLRTGEAKGEESWSPSDGCRQFVTYYEPQRSVLHFVKWGDADWPCLDYDERLGCFTSFDDYRDVPMMAAVRDRYLSFRDGRLWLQNEGPWCTFFGEGRPLSVTYRAVADADAIWTNLSYRADFHRTLDEAGRDLALADQIIDGGADALATYLPDEHLDTVSAWDEYQRTGDVVVEWRPRLGEEYPDARKKFRLWRMDLPRALKGGANRYGLDRLRNPWIYIRLTKSFKDGRDMLHLHSAKATCYLNGD